MSDYDDPKRFQQFSNQLSEILCTGQADDHDEAQETIVLYCAARAMRVVDACLANLWEQPNAVLDALVEWLGEDDRDELIERNRREPLARRAPLHKATGDTA